mmetsp:Transcript_11170/g.18770  ORF Transcript_11170/g.18770 Transcript_11170/m.18770 type:complete len:214 (-) Transcript_11170:156-797(-)
MSRLLIENHQFFKNQPIQYFSVQRDLTEGEFNNASGMMLQGGDNNEAENEKKTSKERRGLSGATQHLNVSGRRTAGECDRGNPVFGRASGLSGCGQLNTSNGGGMNTAKVTRVPFISSLSVKHIYEVLNVRQYYNIEFQAFFALLQQGAEDMQIMDLNDKRQDDFVPIDVLEDFIRSYIKGFNKLMRDTGFAAKWRQSELNKLKYKKLNLIKT